MPDNVQVPRNLREFKIEIGKADVTATRRHIGLGARLDGLTDDYFAERTDRWRQQYFGSLGGVVKLLERAATYGSDVRARLSADLDKDALGVRTFLETCGPEHYFTQVFMAATQQQGPQLRDFLVLVRQLIR